MARAATTSDAFNAVAEPRRREILLLLAVGLVGGVLLSQLYRHRRRSQLAKKARKPADAGPDLVGRDEAERKPS